LIRKQSSDRVDAVMLVGQSAIDQQTKVITNKQTTKQQHKEPVARSLLALKSSR
jgi:hypothetical protein